MEHKLKGTIVARHSLTGTLRSESAMQGQLSIPRKAKEFPLFEGPYRLTSDAKETVTYETKDKVMKDNIVVLKVPYYEVSNEKGTTVYIGKDQYNG